MTVSNSIPATIQMRRSSLVGIIAAVAVLAAGITAVLLVFAVNTGSSEQRSVQTTASSPSQSDQAYVKGITSLTPAQQAAAFGGPGAMLDALGLSGQDTQYVQGVTSMTPVEQAAAFGTPGGVLNALELSARDKQYVKGITRLSPVQMAAAFGGPGAVLDSMGLDPQDKQYVQGITSLTPAQQAAAFGTER
jgi:hypothetical protein